MSGGICFRTSSHRNLEGGAVSSSTRPIMIASGSSGSGASFASRFLGIVGGDPSKFACFHRLVKLVPLSKKYSASIRHIFRHGI